MVYLLNPINNMVDLSMAIAVSHNQKVIVWSAQPRRRPGLLPMRHLGLWEKVLMTNIPSGDLRVI